MLLYIAHEQHVNYDKNTNGETWNFAPSRYHESTFFVPAEPEEFEEMTGKKVLKPGDPESKPEPELEPQPATVRRQPSSSTTTTTTAEPNIFDRADQQSFVILPTSRPIYVPMPSVSIIDPMSSQLSRGVVNSRVVRPKKAMTVMKPKRRIRRVYKIAKKDKHGKPIPGQYQLVRPVSRRQLSKTGRRIVIKPTLRPGFHKLR